LIGVDALSFKDRMTLECARSIREDFLHQNAFDPVDTYASPKKQHGMLAAILAWYDGGLKALENDVSFNRITSMNVVEKLGRLKYVPEDVFAGRVSALRKEMDAEYAALTEGVKADA